MTHPTDDSLNQQVQGYWERRPCGTAPDMTGGFEPGTRAWFEYIEEYRYTVEPFIHSVAQFTRYHGKKILEVGVGAGTDHLQWARAGGDCYGVDLTDAAIETTRARLQAYGFDSKLQRVDAEQLPFPDDEFDVVYSWGVIHHTAHPERIIQEAHRVLKPRGVFIGMMYGRRSVHAVKLWIFQALLTGRPWRTLGDVIWHHMESVGTKAYTVAELTQLFSAFSQFSAQPVITIADRSAVPRWLCQFLPDRWGWFIPLRAVK